MADSEGPGAHKPRTCSGISFSDLSDSIGFREPGGNATYGLKLTPEGLYSRAEISRRLIDLEDVGAGFKDLAENLPVRLVKHKGKWIPEHEEPRWDVKLEILRTTAYTEPGHVVTKIVNQGLMMVSYAVDPSDVIKVSGFSQLYHIYVEGKKNVPLQAIVEFSDDLDTLRKPPAGSTICLEVLARGYNDWVEVIDGLSLKSPESRLVHIIITKPTSGGPYVAKSSDPEVQVKVDKKISIASIYINPQVRFVRLLFSVLPVSDVSMSIILARDSRIEALLKHWVKEKLLPVKPVGSST